MSAKEMAASKRRRGREMALQMLYQQELGGTDASEVKASFDPFEYALSPAAEAAEAAEAAAEPSPLPEAESDVEAPAEVIRPEITEPLSPELVRRAYEFAEEIFEGTLARREEIDALVTSQAENWRLERMPAVDRNILRLAVYELLAEPDVPPLVVLDEAIELAKRYGSDQSSAFVNGLLDGLLKGGAVAAARQKT